MKASLAATRASAAEALRQRFSHAHLIGIGGVSMSALASTLHAWGLRVSGSDSADSAELQRLRDQGVPVHVGHCAEHLGAADLVVYTTAIRPDNPELIAARQGGRELWHRSQLLAAVMADKQRVAVAGTHGKSSTTCMVATVLAELGLDPTLFVGALSHNFGSNYYLGRGPQAVFEACESDGSFLAYGGCSQVITSLEPDHLDQHGTLDNLVRSFANFAASADPQGFLVYAAGSPLLAEAVQGSPARQVSYGLGVEADYQAGSVRRANGGIRFMPRVRGETLGEVRLPVIGDHNIRNALAALAVAVELGLDPQQAAQALGAYRGVQRRFERLGKVDGYEVIDDYAHHPTEIEVTLRAARQHYGRRLLAIFQPHLYSRTRDLLQEFSRAFSDADIVVIADIYAARESPCTDISSEQLHRLVASHNPGKLVVYLPSFEQIEAFVREQAQPGDLVLTIGAGDIRRVGERLVATAAPAAPCP